MSIGDLILQGDIAMTNMAAGGLENNVHVAPGDVRDQGLKNITNLTVAGNGSNNFDVAGSNDFSQGHISEEANLGDLKPTPVGVKQATGARTPD